MNPIIENIVIGLLVMFIAALTICGTVVLCHTTYEIVTKDSRQSPERQSQ